MSRHRGLRVAGWASLVAGAAVAVLAWTLSAPPVAAEARTKDWRAGAAKADHLVLSHLRSQKDLVVAPRAAAADRPRQAARDLAGVIPTEAETVALLSDGSPEKRAALVDRLLASQRHADWFATWYSNLLAGTALRDRNMNRRTFNDWLREQFRRNRPYDEMVYDLVTASGNSEENGAIGFTSQFDRSAADAVGRTSRYFLGVQIQCAQCHDHPYDRRIKQQDFGTFAAFFMTTSVRRNQTPGNPEVSFDVMSHEKEDLYGARRGGRGATGMAPAMRPGAFLALDPGRPTPAASLPDAKFLLGKPVKDVPGVARRDLLAKWMTSPSNDWFAPAFANRMWAYFLGHGIVHPVDDFSNTNKPTNPELLKHLADEFVKSGFDVNHLIRVVVGTEAYQRTSKTPRDLERPDASLYAIAPVKPLTVEQSFDSFFRATGAEGEVERRLSGGRGPGMAPGRGRLVDPRMAIYQLFRGVFDDDELAESEEFTGTIPRGLLMMNGGEINRLVSDHPESPLYRILDSEKSDRERIRRVYLTALSREPSPGELSNALQHVHTSRNDREGYAALLWGLLNTTEFMSNH